MESAYVDIMIQSLGKKIQVLEQIRILNSRQKELLEDDKADADEFDKTVEEKAVLIEQMTQLDSGFDKLFERVKVQLDTNRSKHAKDIRIMQEKIQRITELNVELQAQESRNKDLMTQKFVSVRERAKVVRTSKKAVNQYYQNMMQLNVIEPQFMDNKK